MEFSVTKSALLNELSTTQGVVERKTTIPILSNLLVEAKGSQLTITATDLEAEHSPRRAKPNQERRRRNHPCQEITGTRASASGRRDQGQLLENHWVEIVADRKNTNW